MGWTVFFPWLTLDEYNSTVSFVGSGPDLVGNLLPDAKAVHISQMFCGHTSLFVKLVDFLVRKSKSLLLEVSKSQQE